MNRSLVLIAVALTLSIGMVTAAGRIGGADTGTAAASQPPASNPVVAVIPIVEQTRYDYDAFRTGEIDRTITEVQTVMLVHADGTTQTRRVR